MIDKVKGNGEHAVAICNALGVDPKTCMSLDFSMESGKLIVITVKRYVREDQAKAFAKVIEKFNLVPKEPVQDVTAIADEAIRKAFRT